MLAEATVEVPVDDRYRLLIDGITDYAIYMLDTEGYVSSWNAGAQRFKGYNEDEISGRAFLDLLHGGRSGARNSAASP